MFSSSTFLDSAATTASASCIWLLQQTRSSSAYKPICIFFILNYTASAFHFSFPILMIMSSAFWSAISATHPDVFAWLGDVVYSDDRKFAGYFEPSPIERVQSILNAQKSHPSYVDFQAKVPIVGIWDDHDSCSNNGGIECEQRLQQQPLFLDFLDEPWDSPRRKLHNKAIYTSYTWGSSGSSSSNGDHNRQATLILLDNRSERGEPLLEDVLGETQWAWLESQLAQSTSRLHFIASGIQFTPVDKWFQEKWASHPGSFERLVGLLKKYQTPGVVFLSGDVHWAELFRQNCTDLGYPLFEITSSGLTHSCMTQAPFGSCHFLLNTVLHDRYRMVAENGESELLQQYRLRRQASSSPSGTPQSTSTSSSSSHASFIPASSPSLPHSVHPKLAHPELSRFYAKHEWTEQYNSQSEFVYGDMNFGLIEIDWDSQFLSLQARRAWDGLVMFERMFMLQVQSENTLIFSVQTTHVIRFDELTPQHHASSSTSNSSLNEFCSVPISEIRLWPVERFFFLIIAILLSNFLLCVMCTIKLIAFIRRTLFQQNTRLRSKPKES